MKIAVIGSRTITTVQMEEYLPKDITTLISGGAKGIDVLAERYADKNNIPKEILLPQYEKYGRRAPIIKNKEIINRSDCIIAFWDGKSKGTRFAIEYATKKDKPIKVYYI